MPKISSFEEYTMEYDNWFVKNNNLYLSELNAIKEFIPVNKNGIEIGIGTGQFALPLGINIGVEPSVKMAEVSKNKGINVIKAVAENLPVDNEKYDFVLMVTTVCFFDDVQQAFNEAYRILKHNGFIIVGLIDKNSELGKIYEKNKTQSKFYNQANFYSVDEITNYLKKADFKNFQYRQSISTKENIIQEAQEGYGKGSFVVVKAEKQIIN